VSEYSLYIDCTNGVSGDMLCKGLLELCGDPAYVENQQRLIFQNGHGHSHEEGHNHDEGHGHDHRSFVAIRDLLQNSSLNEPVKKTAIGIYTVLAKGEAEVHGETLDTVHFHEVGRPEAILNMVGIAAAVNALDPDEIYCSTIHDGTGTVLCSHGEIPVPVPAVRAMMKTCNLNFVCDDVNMEMVTPTGLAALIGLGVKNIQGPKPAWNVVKSVISRGTRGDLPGIEIMIVNYCTINGIDSKS